MNWQKAKLSWDGNTRVGFIIDFSQCVNNPITLGYQEKRHHTHTNYGKTVPTPTPPAKGVRISYLHPFPENWSKTSLTSPTFCALLFTLSILSSHLKFENCK